MGSIGSDVITYIISSIIGRYSMDGFIIFDFSSFVFYYFEKKPDQLKF